MNKTITISIHDIRPYLRMINLYPCKPGYNSGFRRLYHHYFLYVHKGKGIIIIDNKSYNTVPGDLFYCPPGIPNAICADNTNPFLLSGIDFDFTWNHREKKLMYPIQAEFFNPDFVTEYIKFTDFDGFPDRITLPEDKVIRQLIYDMIHQYTAQKKFWDHYVSGILQAFIVTVIQRIIQRESGVVKSDIGDEIIGFLTDNYMYNLNNKKIADKFHYNADYINRLVVSYTGVTLKQYIIDLRIRTALNLLINTDTSIKEIASKVGYENTNYFYRIFKKKTGYAPGYFRQHININTGIT